MSCKQQEILFPNIANQLVQIFLVVLVFLVVEPWGSMSKYPIIDGDMESSRRLKVAEALNSSGGSASSDFVVLYHVCSIGCVQVVLVKMV